MAAPFRLMAALCAGVFCCAGQPQDLLTRIREHMREYVSQLPDYTCRVTIERSTRRSGRSEFALTDRLRLEVAYTGGNELYAWPGSASFERTIEELLPAHGMVSNGSYALHMRTLFLRNVARFGEPQKSGGRVELTFSVPAVLSGYALSTGAGSVPAGLEGSVWLDAGTLDLVRLEVRVATRLAHSAETTTYTRARIGDVEFVVPQTSELVLVDPERMQLRNLSRFDDYHRFAGMSTVHYEPVPEAAPAPVKKERTELDEEIGPDAAIGDRVGAGRITDMRRVGKDSWNIEVTVGKSVIRKTVKLVWR
jgi:hypothetical protein